jgi:hypothetical protein
MLDLNDFIDLLANFHSFFEVFVVETMIFIQLN